MQQLQGVVANDQKRHHSCQDGDEGPPRHKRPSNIATEKLRDLRGFLRPSILALLFHVTPTIYYQILSCCYYIVTCRSRSVPFLCSSRNPTPKPLARGSSEYR